MRAIKIFALAILALFGMFTATAIAATAVAPADASWTDLLRPVYDAFTHGQYLAAGMAALVLAVAVLKRYAPSAYGISDWVHGDIGGTVLTLAASFGGALGSSLAGGVGVSWAMVKTATIIAAGAAGGYAIIKKLVIVPFLKPWADTKAPAWLRPILALVLWMFDKPTPVEVATAAGEAAVAAKPADGIAGSEQVKEVQ